MTIGEFIKKYRLRYRLSSRKFALSFLNIGESGKSRMEKWEQGKGSPKDEDAELIKKYFAVSSLGELTEDYLNQLISELVPRGTPGHEKITIEKSLEDFLAQGIEERESLSASVSVLKAKLVELMVIVSKLTKEKPMRSYSEISLDVDRMMQDELKHRLERLKHK